MNVIEITSIKPISKEGERLIYLASPYTHPKRSVMAKRLVEVSNVYARLTRKGHILFAPICMNATAQHYSDVVIGHSWDFWQRFDTEFLRRSDELWVVMMDGWRQSKGVQAEIKIARYLGLPIAYVDPDTLITTYEIPKIN